MDQSNNVGFLLQYVAFCLARQSDVVLQKKLGIGFSQFKILLVLDSKPGIMQKEIAQHLGQTEASISRQIKYMFDDGLLHSIPRTDDKREHVTTLTPHGQRITQEAMDILNDHHAPVFESLSIRKQKQLIDILKEMQDIVCKIK